MKHDFRKAQISLTLALAGLLGLGLVLPQTAMAGLSPAGVTTDQQAVAPLVTEVKKWKNKNWNGKNWKSNKHIYVGPRRGGVYVRGWNRRPYYGTVIAGVALGTIIAATTAPRAPADNLCWYWTNPSKTRGYWDYCY
ncbi:MAG TPA: hypothetical protein VMW57_09485 [Methyloceanibacter sp.]|nr:hypothetical protein [Methyloceanibacter sp.]